MTESELIEAIRTAVDQNSGGIKFTDFIVFLSHRKPSHLSSLVFLDWVERVARTKVPNIGILDYTMDNSGVPRSKMFIYRKQLDISRQKSHERPKRLEVKGHYIGS